MKAAAASWLIRPCRTEDDFWNHLLEVVREAARLDAELVVLPELAVLELEGMFTDVAHLPQERSPLLASSFASVQHEVDLLGLTLVAGSAFERIGQGWVNRSPVLKPKSPMQHQDKQVLTQWEQDPWGLVSGAPLARLEDPSLGVLVCYDCEFPPLCHRLAEEGMLILAVPSYTETWHGHHRVRTSCRARAVENQIFVLHSCLTGTLGREPVPQAHGSAAVLAPSAAPFPPDGILAETAPDEEALAVADLDLQILLGSRNEGDVRNWNDRLGPWSTVGTPPALCNPGRQTS